MVKTRWITRSVALGTVDAAGETICEDMEGNATTKIDTPAWAKQIRRVRLVYTTDGASLGSSVGFINLEDGCVYGRNSLICGGGGSEDVDAKHDIVVASSHIVNIPVIGGSKMKVSGQMSGEDSGDIVVTASFEFCDQMPQHPMLWWGYENQLTAVDTDTGPMADMDGTTDKPNVPEHAKRIRGIGSAIGSDLGALGAGGHAVLKISDQGVIEKPHEYLIGGSGGELITSAGDTVPAVYDTDLDIEVQSGVLKLETRQTGEDTGTISVGVSIGFEMPAGPRR